MNLKDLVNKFSKDPVYFGTAIVTVGVFGSSVFSYLFQLGLARLLTVGEFGTFNALLSLSYIVSVPTSVFLISLMKIVSTLKAEGEFAKITKLFGTLTVGSTFFGILVFAGFWFFRFTLSKYLNIENPDYFIWFGLYMSAFYYMIYPSAFLQGLLRFKAFAFFSLVSAFLRCVLGLLFVYSGYKIAGIYAGFAIAALLSFGIGAILLKQNFVSKEIGVSIRGYLKKIFLFSGPVLFVNLGMLLLNNIDLILVKRLFDPVTVGYYASVMTIGKIILFGAGTVAIVMLPQISEKHASKLPLLNVFYKFLILQIVLVVGGVGLFALFPKLIVEIMFGNTFLPAVEFVPLFSIFVALYVLINFLVTFFLAIEKNMVFLFQIPTALFQYFLISKYHQNLYQIILINIFVLCGLLVSLVAYLIKIKASREIV